MVRAIAFIGIFTSHCRTSELGVWGVSVFFVLSGFLLIYSYYNKNISNDCRNCFEFGIKKLKKLYSLHIITLIGALLLSVIGFIKEFSAKKIIEILIQMILNITLLQSWIPCETYYFSLNGVSWYLSVYMFLCMCFPCILTGLKKISNVKMMITIIFIAQVTIAISTSRINVYAIDGFLKWLTYICPLYRLGDFLVGCCVGTIFVKKDKWRINNISATIVEIMVICIIVICNNIYITQFGVLGNDYIRYSILYTPSSALLVLIFAINKGYISKVLTCKPFVYIGNISAYAFLIHQLVIRYISTGLHIVFKMELEPWTMAILAFAVTIGCSELWKKIESINMLELGSSTIKAGK